MPRGGLRVSATQEQIQLALSAPRRPETADCTLCSKCGGGNCASWRELRASWVESWRGEPPPDGGDGLQEWWKSAKAQHKYLVAAAGAKGNAAGKRAAPADGTPNKGGQRKDAPSSATRAQQRQLQLPLSFQDSSGAGSSTSQAAPPLPLPS